MNVDEEACWKGGRRGELLSKKQVSKRIGNEEEEKKARLGWG